jgi:exosortase A
MDRRSASADSTAAGASPGFNAPLWIVLGALALTAILYWPTSLELISRWGGTSDPYAHGWLVVGVTVWLTWRDRASLASTPVAPARGGWLLVALGSLGWFVVYRAGLMVATTLALPALVLCAVWAAGGLALARRVALPVLLLYMAIPVWDVMVGPLQWMTAAVNGWLTRLVGIPVVMQEFTILIPAGTFEIVGGCSGLNYFVTAVFIAVVLGELDRDDLRSRCLLVAVAVGLAIVTNWLRVFIIIVAGHLTNMQHYLVRADHYKFGWLLFAVALVGFFWLASRLPRRGQVEPASRPEPAATPAIGAQHALVYTAMALALGPARLLAQSLAPAPVVETIAPPAIPGWDGPTQSQSGWQPVFVNADEEMLVAYMGADRQEVAVYRALYRLQHQGKELRGYGNTVAGPGRRVLATDQRSVLLPSGAAEISEQEIGNSDVRRSLVWSLYTTDGQPDPMGLQGQLAYGVASLWRPPVVSVIALATDCRSDCALARDSLEALAPAVLPLLLAAPHSGSSVSN